VICSFILMKQFGISSNIMSLSGIAIAIGVLVDAAIVMTENVIRHCERAEEEKARRLHGATVSPAPHSALSPSDGERVAPGPGEANPRSPTNESGHASIRLTAGETLQATLEAARQVGRPIFFAMVIIILAFVPVFALSGQEGKLFHPLAFTKTFAMIGSTVLAVTIVRCWRRCSCADPFHAEDQKHHHADAASHLRSGAPIGRCSTARQCWVCRAVACAAFVVARPPAVPAAKLETWNLRPVARLARGISSEFTLR
jgi:Cu(I)/Ag(I) efflux system membrane protein CusA/SilA